MFFQLISPFLQSARKSALLSVAKREQLKQKPGRVRFAENVRLSDSSPLYSQDGSDNQMQLEHLPNILKVYLENGQTKTFKYDSTTTVQVRLSLSLFCLVKQ
jgi:hypothetical protein